MQRMITHDEGLPRCRQHGHRASHFHDARAIHAGGGHLIECPCSGTGKHVEFADALDEWCRSQGHPIPKRDVQASLPLGNVRFLQRTAP